MQEQLNAGKDQAEIVKRSAMNTYYTYSFVSRAPFYAMVAPQYQDFMARFVRNWLWWADGWVPYFHNAETGIPSTRLAQSLVQKTARKIVGGRLMYKNAGKDATKETENPAIVHISEWAKDTGFECAVKKATEFATAGGTSLLKLNVGEDGKPWVEAKRFDTFIPTVDALGNIVAVECFIKCFTDLGIRGERIEDGKSMTSYYLVEKRYYGCYEAIDGAKFDNVPIAEYCIKQATGSVTSGEFVSNTSAGEVMFDNLPREVRRAIGNAYRGINFKRKYRLPFTDLGCQLMKFTETVSGIPELPFGESLLAPIITHLEEWDYYHACAMTDMYLGRGRVLVPKAIQGANAGAYGGMDETIYSRMESTNPDAQKPTPIQFEIRSAEWEATRTRIIQDISITTGLNISTIASFINDNTAARTAREISTEENETASFVNDKRSIIENPINKIIETVLRHDGYTDDVVIRWSGAGLTNRYALAEIISMGLQAGFLSKYQAVQMFNFDDDTCQVQEEYERVKKDGEIDMPYGGEMNDTLGID